MKNASIYSTRDIHQSSILELSRPNECRYRQQKPKILYIGRATGRGRTTQQAAVRTPPPTTAPAKINKNLKKHMNEKKNLKANTRLVTYLPNDHFTNNIKCFQIDALLLVVVICPKHLKMRSWCICYKKQRPTIKGYSAAREIHISH